MGRSKKNGIGTGMTSSSGLVAQEPNMIVPDVKPDPARPWSTNQLVFIYKNVMPGLFKLKSADAFKDPVNPYRMKLMNYYSFIKNPMDLKTIRERLRNNFYQSSSECIRDFQLMFCNTLVYNQPDTLIVLQAIELEAAFLLRLKEMPKEEVEVLKGTTGFIKQEATPVKKEAVMDAEPPKRSSVRSPKPVIRYTPPTSTALAFETDTPSRKKKRASSSSSSCSPSSTSSSSSSSNSSSDSDSSDSDNGKLENSNNIQLLIIGIESQISKLEKQKRQLKRQLEKSMKKDNKKSRKGRKKGRKRKTSSSKTEEKTAKPANKKLKTSLQVPKRTPVVAPKGKGKRAGGGLNAITTQDRIELRQQLEKLKTSDLSMLMGILGSTDEIDVGAMDLEQFQLVQDFVNSKLAKGRIASTPSPPLSLPSSPEKFAPMTNGFAHATVPIETETLDSPGSPGSEVPFYDSEDERLLNTY
ncbi:unnamed protein product [Orchesella dallaii]|uniref:Bromo domain-containing protein n=1 Tax=Orchesella dallaii TaxID=48710 RepID=A0ABP1S4V0_9HEXA